MANGIPELRLHSVMLGAGDLDASVAFYTERLGLTLRARFGGFALLELGTAMLTLSEELSRARPPVRAPVEIVLAVASVRSAYASLRARGITFFTEPHLVDGTNEVANFEDPDGHVLSLYGPP